MHLSTPIHLLAQYSQAPPAPPSRGLRQGDPISPYLFMFCAEGLNALFHNATSRGEIKGFSICRNGPKLTHLSFANDCMIFCKSTLEECNKI